MPSQLIDYYRAIETTSSSMLESAKLGAWEAVIQSEGACAILISQLRHHSQNHALSIEDRHEKRRIMLQILRNDAQIRIMMDPWLEDLEKVMHGGNLVLN
ncbi:flagellar protein FliT [Limnohabitans planktonicus]|uniref:Flagellar protein FliT n=1 Tax=Limnohabitans planktonicus II-D5 TaxID=1293045 RepID=A0A2T7UJC3_9BURK|nr:flagellar protein FliT [Limnohabitans planktonicus]PVE44773.1 flagellar protein FliT [Limnohabitans planktonicus II-D5]